MQRGTYVIALSAEAVEGGLVARGEAQPGFAQSVLWPAESDGNGERPRAALETFLTQAGWERGFSLLVLPTEQISFRRLHFDFSEPKKIRQVLPFELEHELLDGLAGYAYDAEILPAEDGGADVHVYLTERAPLEAAASMLEQHQLGVQRATFSAVALAEAHPAPQGSHFFVYVGSDEAFAAHAIDGHLSAVQSLTPHPGELLAELSTLVPGSPTDRLQALFREGGEEEPRASLREALRERLDATREELNRFLRVHCGGEAYTVSLYGLFGELYEWNESSGLLTLRFPQGAWPGALRTHYGVLEDLLRQPAQISGRGLNFRKRIGTWLAIVRDLRRPLIAAAVLLTTLLGLGITAYSLRASALQAHLNVVERDIRRVLSINGPLTSITVNAALGRVQERLDRLRREREAVAYLERYHYDTLRLIRDLSETVRQQPGVTVDAVTFNLDRFTMSGVTPSYTESESLKNRMAAMPRFEGRTVKVTHSNSGQAIRYRLSVEKEK